MTVVQEMKLREKERDEARAEVATLKTEVAQLKAAAVKPVVAAVKPLDVVALIEGAHGAEKMRLYREHKTAYDAAHR